MNEYSEVIWALIYIFLMLVIFLIIKIEKIKCDLICKTSNDGGCLTLSIVLISIIIALIW